MRAQLTYCVVGIAGIFLAIAFLKKAGVEDLTATFVGCAIGFAIAELVNFLIKKG